MNKPEKVFQMGKVSVAVFKNSSRHFRSCTVSVSYRDSDGSWKRGSSLQPSDALVASHLLKQAADYMAEMENKNWKQGKQESKPDSSSGWDGPGGGPDDDIPF